MTPEMWTMIAVGVPLAGLSLVQYRSTRQQINRVAGKLEKKFDLTDYKLDALRREFSTLRERMAKLEGLLEGLREAISDRRAG